ncbi:hypothetical protein DFH08DRAFT_251414 [Mycena albidolilacea]|uniref:Uncharacterized protein n=1 Tax=Mycena albidolilacea TaxID=1033008 RepID=A0AAD6ZTT4_9AGAR|nr:hypothetical protein DFH08DRAFT_251414 [Mycena albidolilacea]
MGQGGGPAHPRAGVALCSPPRPRADRAALDSTDTDDRTRAKRRRASTYLPSPPSLHPPMLYTAACWSATHDRADAYSPRLAVGAYAGVSHRYYPRQPSDRAASAATRRRCICIRLRRTLPLANRDIRRGRKGGGPAPPRVWVLAARRPCPPTVISKSVESLPPTYTPTPLCLARLQTEPRARRSPKAKHGHDVIGGGGAAAPSARSTQSRRLRRTCMRGLGWRTWTRGLAEVQKRETPVPYGTDERVRDRR